MYDYTDLILSLKPIIIIISNEFLIPPIRLLTASKQTSQLFDKKTSSTCHPFYEYFKHSESFFQVRDSSSLVFIEFICFGSLCFPKEALLISNQTHFYSSFIFSS